MALQWRADAAVVAAHNSSCMGAALKVGQGWEHGWTVHALYK